VKFRPRSLSLTCDQDARKPFQTCSEKEKLEDLIRLQEKRHAIDEELYEPELRNKFSPGEQLVSEELADLEMNIEKELADIEYFEVEETEIAANDETADDIGGSESTVNNSVPVMDHTSSNISPIQGVNQDAENVNSDYFEWSKGSKGNFDKEEDCEVVVICADLQANEGLLGVESEGEVSHDDPGTSALNDPAVVSQINNNDSSNSQRGRGWGVRQLFGFGTRKFQDASVKPKESMTSNEAVETISPDAALVPTEETEDKSFGKDGQS
jgi:hypothetical protein